MKDEDIGYLKRAVEDLAKLVEAHMKREEQERADLETMIQKIADTQKEIQKELSLYQTIYRGIKWLGALIILLVTLKFGDIPKLFH